VSESATPVVSVVLRTYDHAAWIAQAIESVLIQRAPFPFELVIGEDCSADGTRAIVQDYARGHPDTIRAVLPERNLGHGEILRRTLAQARGRYVAYLDGDDYWTSPAKLARQVDFLERNRECPSCFHDVSLVYDHAGIPSGTVSPRLAEARFGLEQIVKECFVPAPSMLFRREVGEQLPGWVFESAWIDWLIHIRAAQRGPLGYLPQALAAYRVHRRGMFSALDRVSQLREDVRFYDRLASELPQQRQLIERCMDYRHAQLAIERLGVTLDSCVVLVDPAHELRPYFNGRHARNLPRRDGHEVTELEAIREAARELPAAVGDYGAHSDPDRQAGCYVVVPRAAAAWLSERPQLAAYLERHGRVTWEDRWVCVHELAPLAADNGANRWRETRRVEVVSLLPADGDPAAFLEAPPSGVLLPAHAIAVSGWVVGHGEPVVCVQLELDGEVLWRAPVTVRRPDVAAARSQPQIERCGFQTSVNAQEVEPGTRPRLIAVFADGLRVPVAELCFQEAEPIGAGNEGSDRGSGANDGDGD
jgi:glycosyltransferase involved in cell wall biosynthesis